MADDLTSTEPHRTVRLNDLTVRAGYEDVLRASGLDSLDAMFAVSNGESLNKPGLSSWRERIRLTLATEPQAFLPMRRDPNANSGWGGIVYLKRFANPPRRASREVRRSGSGASSAGGVEWVWLNRLIADGIPCPRPIAFGEELAGSCERRSVLLTEAVPGKSLERWMTLWGEPDRPTIRQLIGPTADMVARLHNHGYIHRDLYLSHLFFDPEETSDRCLHLIDLARVIRPTRGHLRWIVKDLASLSYSTPASLVSRTDRLRWLKRYLQVSKLDGSGRRLVYRIVGKTDRIARHERRRQARFRSWSEP